MPTLAKKLHRPWKPQPKNLPPSGYKRTERDERYNTYRWHHLSEVYRVNHPLCIECLKKGIYTPAQVVDHIVPVPICQDFWDENNLQPLCKKCNAIKGNRDKKIIAQYRAEQREGGVVRISDANV